MAVTQEATVLMPAPGYGEPGEALAEWLAWTRHQDRPEPGEALREDLSQVVLTAGVHNALRNKAYAVLNYWLDRHNLHAAMFLLKASPAPPSYADQVAEMDREQVETELRTWASQMGYSLEEALTLARRLGGG